MLNNKKELQKLSNAEFQRFDEDNSGTLDTNECVALVYEICAHVGLYIVPRKAKMLELFARCDKDDSGGLSVDEFPLFLKTVLHAAVTKSEEIGDFEVVAPSPLATAAAVLPSAVPAPPAKRPLRLFGTAAVALVAMVAVAALHPAKLGNVLGLPTHAALAQERELAEGARGELGVLKQQLVLLEAQLEAKAEASAEAVQLMEQTMSEVQKEKEAALKRVKGLQEVQKEKDAALERVKGLQIQIEQREQSEARAHEQLEAVSKSWATLEEGVKGAKAGVQQAMAQLSKV